MNRFTYFIRKPVKRQGAEHYLLITLLSFAASVTLTRLFLEITGYPQLGGGEMHIAHVLWGGLFLFLASLLPLVAANRWAFTVSAILSGAGVGLFIDEVGKFITSNNNYFYPLAAPIIYAFFLLVVLLYLRIRRPPTRSPRAELFRALDGIEEVLEHDLDPHEQAELENQLSFVAQQKEEPHLAHLAQSILNYLPSLTLVQPPDTLLNNLHQKWELFEQRWLSIPRLKAILSGGLFALGIVNISKLSTSLPIAPSKAVLESLLTQLVLGGQIRSVTGISWFLISSALEASVGFFLILAAALLVAGKDRIATNFGIASLLVSLSAVNLLVFYFDQFSTIFSASIQFILLVGIGYYRRRINTY